MFHAAAYKHVSLIEENPLEAVRNNVIGTRVVAAAAAEAGAERFVLVSTDKAVNPATVLGASKAMAEWIVRGARTPPREHDLLLACGSATCSARAAASCRSSGARSSRAAR